MVQFALPLLGGIVAQAALAACQTTPLTGSHTEIPRWCGKPYEAGAPNFDPGGQLHPPAPRPSELLFVNVFPRHNIYVSSESQAELVVDAAISKYHGQSLSNVSSGTTFDKFYFSVLDDTTSLPLLTNSVPLNTTDNLFNLSLSAFQPRTSPYALTLTGGPTPGSTLFTAKTTLTHLPAKTTGSTVKLDHLSGNLLYANPSTNFTFVPILPFGFYTSCSGYLTSQSNVTAYAALGFNAINPVCDLTDGNISSMFDWLSSSNILFQYDMRNSFYNLTSVASQVALIKDHPGLLSWYTADEPDGWEYSFASVTSAYDLLKDLDPYHPTGLVLNCANYYFSEYSSGADYIMQDAYPVGINATYSYRGTPCNLSYGDCGCDNCKGSLTDLSERIDSLYEYQSWLGRARAERKPVWAVQQAFSGEGYWSRDPTTNETHVMNVLALNHGAKGVVSWLFPSSEELNRAHGEMAKVVTVSPVKEFVLGGWPREIEMGSGLDVAVWENGGEVLVGFANWKNDTVSGRVSVPLKGSVKGVVKQVWGESGWMVEDGELQRDGVPALATSFIVVSVEGQNKRRSDHDSRDL